MTKTKKMTPANSRKITDITPNDGTLYVVNGEAVEITDIVQGPVWLNDQHTHLMCTPDNLFVTTSTGFRFQVTPDIKLWLL